MVRGWRHWLLVLLAVTLLVLIPWAATQPRSKHITLLYQGFHKAHVFKSVLPATLLLEQLDGPAMGESLALRCQPLNAVKDVGVKPDGGRMQINEVLLACDGGRTYRIEKVLLD